MSSLRILIADDHNLMRRGLKDILLQQTEWDICAEAVTGTEAVRKAKQFKPDIAILDINMPTLDGFEAARQIRSGSPATEILVLSGHYSDQLIREILAIGARGFVMKSDSERDLVRAVTALANHEPFLNAEAIELILGKSPDAQKSGTQANLTQREHAIVRLIAEGQTSKTIAKALKTPAKMLEHERHAMMERLNLKSVSDIVRYAIRNKIIAP
jgi:DNA-binding NarL/FixJ family response regulator